MKENIQIGHTKKTFGTQGELRLFVEKEFVKDVLVVPVVFLEIMGKQLPYFVEEIKEKDTLILKLEEVDNRETAAPLAGKSLFLRPQDIRPVAEREVVETEEDTAFYQSCVGFTITDENLGEIGQIERIEIFPQQEMAVLFYNKKEVLIPLNESLIKKIETPEKKIQMNLPEGLLEL